MTALNTHITPEFQFTATTEKRLTPMSGGCGGACCSLMVERCAIPLAIHVSQWCRLIIAVTMQILQFVLQDMLPYM